MRDETIHLLASRNFTRGEAQADREAIGMAMARHMWDNARVDDDDEDIVQGLAATSPELRIEVMGSHNDDDVNRELDALARALLSPDGWVQQKLNEIAVLLDAPEPPLLCTARVTRQLSRDGEGSGIVMKTSARFVSAHPDIVDRHYIKPGQDRMVSAAISYRGRVELAGERVPALAARRQELLGTGRERVTKELAAGSDGAGS